MKTVGALWEKEKKEKGKKQTYLTGEIDIGIGVMRVGIFKNEKKEKENQPDYRITLFSFEPYSSESGNSQEQQDQGKENEGEEGT